MKQCKILIFGLLNFISIYGQSSLNDYTGSFGCTLTYCKPEYNPPAGPTLYCTNSSSNLTISSFNFDSSFVIKTTDQNLNCKLKIDNSFNCGIPLGQFYSPDSVWLFIPLGSAFGGGWSYNGSKSVNNQIIEKPINEINLYPNPFNEKINIVCNNKLITKYSLMDLNGKCIITKTDLTNLSIDLSFLNSGIYLIRFEDSNGKTQYRKLIKK